MMGLDRIHFYNVVRLLRVVVPLLVAAVALVFAWNYLERLARGSREEAEIRLGENMSVLTEGMTLAQGEDGRESFRVLADRNLGYDGGVNQLEGAVELTIRGDGETPDRRIRGEQCGVQQEEGAVECEGAIEIELDEWTTARTERIAYDDQSRTVSTQTPVEIVREGAFRIRADRMSVLLGDRLVDLEGHVEVLREDGGRLVAEAIRYDEKTGIVVVSGGVRLVSETLEVSGGHATAIFLVESTTLSDVRFREDVRARLLDAGQPGTLEAGELDVDLASGRLSELRARGEVVVEYGVADIEQVLSGDRVAARFDTDGVLLSLESTGSARMTLASGEMIRSQRIRQRADRQIETGAESLLVLEGVSVEGSEFRVVRADLVHFSTDEPASIMLPAGVVSGERTVASFDPDAGTLISLDQVGSVQFELDGREGRARSVEVDPTWVAFRGSVTIEDSDYTLEADTVRFHRSEDAFEAEVGVFLLTRMDGQPVTVNSDVLRGRGQDAMRFESRVVLRTGGTEVRANEIQVDPAGRSFVARGDVFSVAEGLTVRANTLDFDGWSDVIDYSGEVRARTEEMTIAGARLVIRILEDEIERIDASGGVEVLSDEGMRGLGDAAVYLRAEDSITLTGPDAEVTDPAAGRCTGDEVEVSVSTHAVRVRSRDGRLTVCVPNSGREASAVN